MGELPKFDAAKWRQRLRPLLHIHGLALVVAAIVACEILNRTIGFNFLATSAVMGIAVLYAAYRNGTADGLFAVILMLAYYAYRLRQPGTWNYTDTALGVLRLRAVADAAAVMMIGSLKLRSEHRSRQLSQAEGLYREELQREKEFNEYLINASANGIVAFDQDMRYTVWNPGMERITGLSRDEVMGRRSFEIFPFLIETGLLDHQKLALRGKPSYTTETRYTIPQTGHEGFIKIYYAPIFGKDGEIIGGLGITQEITARVKAEEKLLQSQAALREAQHIARLGSWQRPADATEISCSDEMFSIFGLEPGKVTINTQNFYDFIHPDDREAVQRKSAAYLQAGRDYHLDYRIVRKDGEVRFVTTYGQAAKDDSGRVVRWTGTIQDITEQKLAGLQLRRQTAYLESLHDITMALINRLELKDLLQTVLTQAARLLNTPDCYVYLVDDDQQQITVRYGTGIFADSVGYSMEKGEGLAGQAWANGRLQQVDDYAAWEGRSPKWTDARFHAAVAAPLWSADQITGVIGITYTDPAKRFNEEQVRIIGQFAELASVVIDNARLFASVRDEATRRKKAEEVLRQSEERFRSLTESANDAIISTNENGEITYFNYAAENTFGYGRDQVVGQSFGILLPERYQLKDRPATGLEQFIPSSEVRILGGSVELTVRHKDGHEIPIELSAAKWESSSTGETHQFYTLILRDITDRLGSEERFRLMIEGIRDYAIFMLDPEGRIISWNIGAERINGYKTEEIIGQNFSIFFPPEEAEAGNPQQHLDVAKEQGKYEEEGWRVRKNGDLYYAATLVTALRDPAGELRGFSKVTRDITERHRLDQMKADFLALVSHQLKTPVALVRGYVDNMLSGITGELNDQQKQYLTDIQEISAKNYNLISDLLSVSRLERGVISYDVRPVKLAELVSMALRNYRQRIAARGLELVSDFADLANVMVQVDAFKTAEAIGNIVDNALKFTAQGGITVSASSDADFLSLAITDTGTGMDAETVSRLFQRDQVFTGAPQAEITAGLGLFIAKEFITAQGGEITVCSVPGEGSEFTFKLPLSKVKPKRTSGEVAI